MHNQQMWHRLAPLIFLAAAQGPGACGRAPLGANRDGGGTEPGTLPADTGILPDSAAGGGEPGTLPADTGISRDSPSGPGEPLTLPADTGISRDSAPGDDSPEMGRCMGTPDPCYYGTTDYIWDCTRQAGCTFVYTTGTCHGPPWPCSEFDDGPRCYQQSGCYWYPQSCFGTAIACRELSATTCGNNPGCDYYSPGTSCVGTPVPCSHLQGAMCAASPGCSLKNNGQ